MYIHLFEGFDLHSKACMTWSKGVNIGHRCEGNYYMCLYRLNDFYVEIQYHTGYDGIASIKTFLCEEQLQPYLDKIDLNCLF